MKFNASYYTILALIVISLTAYYYHSELQREQRVTKQQQEDIQQLTDTINYQNAHITMLNELDVKHTKELANAKSEIDVLRNDVAAGHRRLRIAATCNQGEAGSSSRLDDAASPRLNPAAEQDYFDLRKMIVENEQQTKALQDYIRAECQ
ncbi:lysis protein [Photorhabdus laumondii subsp. laumondii]|uniref:Photorhabdus luminescens subsp. laumondii TTO1 complete genome segment 10/17 n=2 Tax=Photorhabdus laumondii subsp. laumondii TaxID=141679 RepID=Q7N318_PHOLL|nr:lysis protein [Photorhabdus laumondii]AWK42611.1 peptidase [Photorhabdus laumondii subsp. laumondii]AXG47936.1 lysis protein [Photorhabdus laumondii subsp. laumondii]MCC8384951.1 lysis protein [Photorhabdus laumondii]MCC8413657.1 lysis protein [Photorhabdus laumondii]NDK96819.1 lysis protein [Photorhabdus laumondii subsp. laumondii]